MAVSGGKMGGGTDGTFSALQKRLAQGKGKMSPISKASRGFKTTWSKSPKAKISKGNPPFAANGATPGLNKPGPGPSSNRGTF